MMFYRPSRQMIRFRVPVSATLERTDLMSGWNPSPMLRGLSFSFYIAQIALEAMRPSLPKGCKILAADQFQMWEDLSAQRLHVRCSIELARWYGRRSRGPWPVIMN